MFCIRSGRLTILFLRELKRILRYRLFNSYQSICFNTTYPDVAWSGVCDLHIQPVRHNSFNSCLDISTPPLKLYLWSSPEPLSLPCHSDLGVLVRLSQKRVLVEWYPLQQVLLKDVSLFSLVLLAIVLQVVQGVKPLPDLCLSGSHAKSVGDIGPKPG